MAISAPVSIDPATLSVAAPPLGDPALDAPDAARRLIAVVWSSVSAGRAIEDDLTGRAIRGAEHYGDLVDLDRPRPLSSVIDEALIGSEPGAATGAGPFGIAFAYGDFEAMTAAVVGQDLPTPTARAMAARRTHMRRLKLTALVARHVYAGR